MCRNPLDLLVIRTLPRRCNPELIEKFGVFRLSASPSGSACYETQHMFAHPGVNSLLLRLQRLLAVPIPKMAQPGPDGKRQLGPDPSQQ